MSGTFTSFQWTFESSHAQNQAANDLNLHFAEADRKQRQRLAEAANAHKLRAGEIEIATARERIAQFHLNAKGIAGGAGRNGGKGVQALAYRSWTGGIDGERGPGGYNALNPEIHPNEKEIAGGTGRNGGKGVQAKAYHRMGGIGGAGGPGGPGGPGGYTALNPKIHPNKREIVGGIGGNGGYGEQIGGNGGLGEGSQHTLEELMAYHPITGGAGGGWGTGGYNARNPEIHPNEKAIAGGTGGKGGDGVQTGGNGGFGEGSQLTQEEWMTYRHIMGGIGGNGGCGDYQGGAGGAGGRSMIDGPLISAVHGEVPHLTTAQFCQQYRLSDDICKLLVDGGFKTAKGLVKITTTGVEEIGLRPRHIADLERALKKFVAEKVK